MTVFNFVIVSLVLALANAYPGQAGHPVAHLSHKQEHTSHYVANNTISGLTKGCKHQFQYVVNPTTKFPMCMGQTDQDLKNGMSIINLIYSRGYLPTCRIMQLMLWMAAEVSDKGHLPRDVFVDIGANIGSCTNHMAGMGFPVISVEPVQQHVDTIQGTIDINPAFHIDLRHIGLSSEDRTIHANFGHGGRNWGASEFHEVSANSSFEAELRLMSLDQVVGHRKVSLMKVDCEGCEWAALKGARKVLKRVPMIKMEVVQPSYEAGNETVTAEHILRFLNASGYDIYCDHWNEQNLYFGNHGDKIQEVDKLFGSDKFKLPASLEHLKGGAIQILRSPIDVASFNHKNFLKSWTDIIAIERGLSSRMKAHFLGKA